LFPGDSEARMLRPNLVWARFDLVNGWRGQSRVLAQLKRWPEAMSYADRSTALGRDLVEQNPSVRRFAQVLDLAFTNQVEVAEKSGDMAGAQAHRLEAENFWRKHPSVQRKGK